MSSAENHNDSESPRGRNMSSSTSNSNHLSQSPTEDQSSSANSSSTGPEESTQLDFAKREISDTVGRSSYSQLSSMTAKSPDRPMRNAKRRKRKHKKSKEDSKDESRTAEDEESAPADDDEDEEDEDAPVGEADDEERIRNPASAVLRKNDNRERIGFRQPFGDTENDSESSAGHTPTDSAQHSPTDLRSTLSSQTRPRRKHYEPARVVLHKSDLGPDAASGSASQNGTNGTNSEFPSRSSSIVPLSVTNSPELGPRPSVSHSIISLLSGSPDEVGNGPLKQLREPKQPIYVPAVLRPTDFDSYDTQPAVPTFSSAQQRKPITQHWVRDANATKCRACNRQFTWYRRRHHCRKCGGVFCAADTSHKVGLDRVLNFNILGIPCRACDACSTEFSGFCLDSPRLRDGPVSNQQPIQGPEQEEVEAVGGGDWSTF